MNEEEEPVAIRSGSKLITASSNASINVFGAVKKAIASRLHMKIYKKVFKKYIDPIETKLYDITASSHDILFKARAIFPFDFFPDTVVVDREKLTIAERQFFLTAKIISVPIRDILSVEVDVGPFFGSLHLTSRYFFTNPRSIKFLWRSHAIKLQRLLQGYIIANERDIDCDCISKPHLEKLLLDLGQGNIE